MTAASLPNVNENHDSAGESLFECLRISLSLQGQEEEANAMMSNMSAREATCSLLTTCEAEPVRWSAA
jgi:hypothetical protein